MTAIQSELHLDTWIGRARRPTQRRPAGRLEATPGLRFAFYERTSTERLQDRWTSRGWQCEMASELVAGHGGIVQKFFDVGVSRRVPWRERPKAAELLKLIEGPECPFDAIVVGEYERAFFGDQFGGRESRLVGCEGRVSCPWHDPGAASTSAQTGSPEPSPGTFRIGRAN